MSEGSVPEDGRDKGGVDMADRVIVMVSDLDDGQHGEINVFEDPEKAARLIESLLESGYEQERIRVFNGDEMAMQVSHRPVVALVGPEADSGPVTEREESTEEDSHEGEEPEAVATAPTTARAEIREEVAATPFVKDGVRFSSLFKPA